MTAYFLDSSALVKRYIVENGSFWIQALAVPDPDNQIIISRITWLEVLSAIARRQREGDLTDTEANEIIQTFDEPQRHSSNAAKVVARSHFPDRRGSHRADDV